MPKLVKLTAIQSAPILAERIEGPKLCTMFVFQGVDLPDVIHVTHKYFGKDFAGGVEAITQTLVDYFARHPFTPFIPVFDRVAYLGEEKDVKVLLPRERDKALFLPDLKTRLDALKLDKWPDYLPHVSVSSNVDDLVVPIIDYVLVQGGNVLWRARGAGALTRLSAPPQRKMKPINTLLDQSNTGLDDNLEGSPEDNRKSFNDLLQPREANEDVIRDRDTGRTTTQAGFPSRTMKEVTADIQSAGSMDPGPKTPEQMKQSPEAFLENPAN